MTLIEGVNSGTTGVDIGFFANSFEHLWDMIIRKNLVEMSPFTFVNEIDLTQFVDRHPKTISYLRDHRFANKHALRSTKSSECSIRDSIRLAKSSSNVNVGDLVYSVD